MHVEFASQHIAMPASQCCNENTLFLAIIQVWEAIVINSVIIIMYICQSGQSARLLYHSYPSHSTSISFACPVVLQSCICPIHQATKIKLLIPIPTLHYHCCQQLYQCSSITTHWSPLVIHLSNVSLATKIYKTRHMILTYPSCHTHLSEVQISKLPMDITTCTKLIQEE